MIEYRNPSMRRYEDRLKGFWDREARRFAKLEKVDPPVRVLTRRSSPHGLMVQQAHNGPLMARAIRETRLYDMEDRYHRNIIPTPTYGQMTSVSHAYMDVFSDWNTVWER